MLLNYTPHAINLYVDGVEKSVIESSGVARCAQTNELVGDVLGIPVYQCRFGEVTGLPAPQPGTAYIVSRIVAEALKGRDDIFVPGPMVRGEDGRPVGCEGLSKI